MFIGTRELGFVVGGIRKCVSGTGVIEVIVFVGVRVILWVEEGLSLALGLRDKGTVRCFDRFSRRV